MSRRRAVASWYRPSRKRTPEPVRLFVPPDQLKLRPIATPVEPSVVSVLVEINGWLYCCDLP